MSSSTAVAPPAESTPTVAGRSPGQALAAALDTGGAEITVDLPVSLPTTFPFFAARPRYTVRHLLGAVAPDGDPADGVPYVHEPAAAHTPAASGTSYAASPEAAFEPSVERARLTWVSATVTLPDGLTGHPGLLAAHIDRRVVVRLCTVENQVLLHGSDDGAVPGLLDVPGRRAAEGLGPPEEALARGAALVEETGGSCDGIVVHPDVYWRLAAGGTLARLNEVGVRVSRTRMIARDRALLGDFRAVATLLDPARSRLVLRRGAGPGGRDVVEAAHQVGLAVHLPQHLVLMDLGTSA
ncbi:family 3 encapsulin nanocompartment shell protein [Thermomonospora amylolytica]|uniref:family 3 encapsulin nanocompartment shell protein n=1 Tax=Thermomonospora amylolytica TaxID=1411117 RepID=UPI0018E55BDF|nr:family 3 encapsulin nanocompartment shell protein [Thermomonospora amylolytica]